MYLMTCTRPDLAYPLSILARYVAPKRHRPEHCEAAKRVSSCEVEIYAGAMAAQDLRWLTYLLTDLGEKPHSRLQRGQLRLGYVATRANTADIFTKALQSASASSVVPPPLFHGCTVPQLPSFTASLATAATDVTAATVTTSSRSRGMSGRRGGQGAGGGGGGGGGGGDDVASGGGGSAGARSASCRVWSNGVVPDSTTAAAAAPPLAAATAAATGACRSQPCGRSHPPDQCFAQLTYTVRLAYGVDGPAPDWLPLVQSYGLALWGMSASQLVDLFGTPHAMYAVVDSSASDSIYSSVVSLGASLAEVPIASVGTCVDTSPGAAPEDASLSFTLDSGASHCFFCDCTRLTPLPTSVCVSLADPTSGPVTACYTTTLPCPAVPSGSLTGFHVPSFSRNLVGVRPLVSLPCVLPSLPPSLVPPCGPCVEGRLRATPHSSSLCPPTESFETLNLDVWGPASCPGPERESFFLVVIDDYSRYTTVFPLAKKYDVTSTLIRWLLTTADTRGRRVSCLHSDCGGEFRFGILAGLCRKQGIRQSWTLPESPQHNGVAERRIGLVMEIARTSMTHAQVSPTSLWTGSPGPASHFCVWGCLALVRDTSADKISLRAVSCVFLGFPEDSSDYTFHHPPLHRFFDSRDVRFDESAPYYVRYPCRGLPVPPAPLFLTSAPQPAPPVQPPPPGPALLDPAGADFCGEDPEGASSRGAGVGEESVPVRGLGSEGAGVGAECVTAGDSSLREAGVSGAFPGGATIGGAPSAGPGEPGTDPVTSGGAGSGGGATGSLESGPGATTAPDTTPPPTPTRPGTRPVFAVPQEQPQQQPQQQQPPPPPVSGLQTLGLPSPSPPSPPSPPVSGPPLPPPDPSPAVFPPPLPPLFPPLSHTWPLRRSPRARPSSPVPFTDLRTALFCSSPPRLSLSVLPSPPELALTASLSTPVTDYYPMHCLSLSLVAAPPTSPLAITGESALGCDALEDRQFELEFLAAASPHLCAMVLAPEGDPDSLDIPTQGLGFRCDLQGALCGQRRPVYGLRQASRKWHDTLCSTLSDLGFQPSSANPSLFVCCGSTPFFVLVYVDDLVFATADRVALGDVKLELQKRHTCTDLGELRHYLGLQITRDRAARTITLSQLHMVQQVLQWFELQHSIVQRTPLAVDHKLVGPFPDEPFEPSGPYAELVDCLMYQMTCTRSDLAFPLGILARFVALGRHRPVHWTAVVRRSTRSSSVSTSTAEAEIYAGAMAPQELRWLTFLLTDLSERPSFAPTLFTDNKGTILLCREPRLESRVKHIDVMYFLLRELQRRGQACFDFVESEANTADIFTKALPPCDHRRCYVQLGLLCFFVTGLVTQHFCDTNTSILDT
ncbi:unnamed protein product [Closterium sp. NIES-53]